MGALSRSKGKRGERECAQLLTELLGVPVKRLLGQERGDTVGDLDGVPGAWSCQVKRCGATPRLGSWWQETCADAGDKLRPALVYRIDRQEWRVLVAGCDVLPAAFDGQERNNLDFTLNVSLRAFAALVRWTATPF